VDQPVGSSSTKMTTCTALPASMCKRNRRGTAHLCLVFLHRRVPVVGHQLPPPTNRCQAQNRVLHVLHQICLQDAAPLPGHALPGLPVIQMCCYSKLLPTNDENKVCSQTCTCVEPFSTAMLQSL
jgi:hypothetical protein